MSVADPRQTTGYRRDRALRIQVVGDDSIGRQARTYAEYRLFAELSASVETARVLRAMLVLRQAALDSNDRTVCAITVETDSGDVLQITTDDGHPYGAINRAVDRIRAGCWPSIARRHMHADSSTVT